MENEEKSRQELDIYTLLEDFLRQALRMWLVGLVLILVCSVGWTFLQKRSYSPAYEAHASFTVRVANPLYGSISSYNEKTAQVMAETFPSILTSDLLRRRVMEELGISGIPSMTVTASAESSILTLKVRDTDPQRAYDVLNAVMACYPEVAEFVVGSTVLVLLDESGVPGQSLTSFSYQQHLTRGGILGGLLWCCLVALTILLKNTIHNEEELRRTLNTPCLGQIPTAKVSKRKPYPLVHHYRTDSGFSESIRLLRLRVEKIMTEEEKKILLISSAIPGEGKTTISANLAASLAQKGKRVLLIDCDLRHPSVVGVLTVKNKPLFSSNSLIDYMKGRITVMEMFQPTELENLFVISGGPGGKMEDASFFSQERMVHLIRAARNLYDYVILDTPPCALLADASEVADLAECGLIVIRQDYAARDQIMEGIQRLSEGKLTIIGCALNNVRKSLTGAYGYGYRNGGRERHN